MSSSGSAAAPPGRGDASFAAPSRARVVSAAGAFRARCLGPTEARECLGQHHPCPGLLVGGRRSRRTGRSRPRTGAGHLRARPRGRQALLRRPWRAHAGRECREHPRSPPARRTPPRPRPRFPARPGLVRAAPERERGRAAPPPEVVAGPAPPSPPRLRSRRPRARARRAPPGRRGAWWPRGTVPPPRRRRPCRARSSPRRTRPSAASSGRAALRSFTAAVNVASPAGQSPWAARRFPYDVRHTPVMYRPGQRWFMATIDPAHWAAREKSPMRSHPVIAQHSVHIGDSANSNSSAVAYRGGLVQQARALLHPADVQRGLALEAPADRLQVGHAELTPDADGLVGPALAFDGRAPELELEVGFGERQIAVVGTLVLALEQGAGALEPAQGDRLVAPHAHVIRCQPARRPGGAADVARRAEGAKGLLARLQAQVVVLQPPGCPPQALPRGGQGWVDIHGPLIAVARLGPVAAAHRLVAGRDRVSTIAARAGSRGPRRPPRRPATTGRA